MSLRNRMYVILVAAICSPVSAQSADWIVAKVSQPARYTVDGKNWLVLDKGMVIPNRSWVSTGPRARVILQREKDEVTFQPGTMAGVFERPGYAIHTDFAQQSGTLQLSIDPRVKPHLAVQTPYLAAVVKGTVFTVSLTENGAAVSVDRGRVEVTDNRSGERTGVKAGQKATVDADLETPMNLSGSNTDFEKIVRVRPRASEWTPAADVKEKSDLTKPKDDVGEDDGNDMHEPSDKVGREGKSGEDVKDDRRGPSDNGGKNDKGDNAGKNDSADKGGNDRGRDGDSDGGNRQGHSASNGGHSGEDADGSHKGKNGDTSDGDGGRGKKDDNGSD